MILVIAASYFCPKIDLNKTDREKPMEQVVSQIVLPITLALIMLVMGMGLTKTDFTRVIKYPKAMLIGLTLQLLVLPLLALIIAYSFQLSAIASAGLFLLSLCPGGATSNMFSLLAKGDVALSVSLTAITSLLIPFSLPITFAAYLAFIGNPIEQMNMPLGLMMKQLIAVTLVPVSVGMLLRHCLTSKVLKAEIILKKMAGISMLTVILLLMATNWATLVKSLSVVGIAALSLCVCSLLLAYLVATKAKLAIPSVRTIAIEVGVQNAGTAMMVAFAVLKQPELALVPLMYGLLMNVPAFSFVWWVNRKLDIVVNA